MTHAGAAGAGFTSAGICGAQQPVGAHAARVRQWMQGARDPESPDAALFAQLIAPRCERGELGLLGLSPAQVDALLGRHYFTQDAAAFGMPAFSVVLRTRQRKDFVTALCALLLRYASPAVNPDDARCMALIIANACLRPDHLWRDLGLAGREDVTQLLERYFPELVARNTAYWRWKKFLAYELALSTGATPGPAPGCPGCEDYAHCFPCER
ncbi:nitrogen fixation protein NifQ [Pollutimonas bauzanensis]|uniref:Nitrogen fixation protein NifQ n=2 Tax=Pollutimonas bauzanensis TaxID=658167 RepID=A0A1M5W0C2_9BURK|nr:nitrogen fixation protein NifQ [Pollutimonas bauzanensis]